MRRLSGLSALVTEAARGGEVLTDAKAATP
jgi:hypothetical protein